MPETIDVLEQRVASAVALIASLRRTAARLEAELATTTKACAAAREAPKELGPPAADPAVLAELERLRAERLAVRERIRGLIADIDRIPW
jgi:hypothetical protein